jgi:hypothetical protein
MMRTPNIQIPDRREQARAEVMKSAYAVGPETVLFLQDLWGRAALRAYWDSLEVLTCARWYSAQRLECAIKWAARHGVETVPGLRAILEEQLDQVPMNAEMEASGQMLFPFMSTKGTEG